MKLRYSALALGLLLVPVFGTATAGPTDGDDSLAWIDLRPARGKLYYLGDDGSLWEESNGKAGLQMAPRGRASGPDVPTDTPVSVR